MPTVRLFMRHQVLTPLVCILLFSNLYAIPRSSAHAQDFTVGCDSSELMNAISTASGDGQADILNLAENCTYSLQAAITIDADSGNLLTINGNGAVLNGNDNVRVVSVSSGADVAILDLTIQAGFVTGTSYGAGLHNSGTLTLKNVTVSDNTSSNGGGGAGIYNDGTMSITDSTVSGNAAIVRDDDMDITITIYTGDDEIPDSGGGIYNSGIMTITNSDVSANSAWGYGGGIFNDGTLAIGSSIISSNEGLFVGGGIFNDGTLAIGSSIISRNDGNGIYNVGTMTVTSSTISTNWDINGGGIWNGGIATVTNSTITRNAAARSGGGIYNWGTMTLTNSTVSENSASTSYQVNSVDRHPAGYGIQSWNGTLTVVNSIIANNDTFGKDCFGRINATYSLIGDGTCDITDGEDGNRTGDPGLGDLLGSPAYYPLLTGSIAIDSGSNALVPVEITLDQAGAPRIQGVAVDMGSYEAES